MDIFFSYHYTTVFLYFKAQSEYHSAMDISLIELGKAAILGIVEGITEFLPISSTGHLIVAGDVLNFTGERAKTFEIFIQLGAILSVVWLYWKKIFNFTEGWMTFWTKILVSFLPAALVGLMFHSYIKEHLFTVYTVALALIGGGIVMLGIEAYMKERERGDGIRSLSSLRFDGALWIGVAQVLALVPGISRSGATIMGGLLQKLDRKTAAEYSFFLAIPTMLAATMFDLLKSRASLQSSDALMFGVGFVFAFVSALFAIKTFIKFISTHSFRGFAWYRIGLGILLLILLQMGKIGVA